MEIIIKLLWKLLFLVIHNFSVMEIIIKLHTPVLTPNLLYSVLLLINYYIVSNTKYHVPL